MRDVDGRLGGAVEVVQRRRRQLAEHLQLRVHRQCLAAAEDAAQAVAGLDTRLVDEGLEHRGYEMQRADLMATNGLDQARRVPVVTGAATASRAPVISGQKNSQTDTSKLNGVFCSTVSPAHRP